MSSQRGWVATWAGAWAAVLALAVWLSQLAPIWLVVAAVGSAAWTFPAVRLRNTLRLFSAALLWVSTLAAAGVQLRLNDIATNWESLQPRIEEPLAGALGDALDNLVEQGELAAARAAELHGSDIRPPELFAELDDLQRTTGVSAIALFDSAGTAIAWAGEHRGTVPAATREGTLSYRYEEGPLFSYLYFVRPLTGGATATAAFLLEASVGAGEGVIPFADRFEERYGARPRFWTPDRARPESIWDWTTADGPILSVSFASLTDQDWWLRAADLGRKSAALLVLSALLALTIAWYKSHHDASGVPVIVATSAFLIAPLGPLISADVLFSPLQFVLPGPLDVSLGTLLIFLAGCAVWLLAHSGGEPQARIRTRWSVLLFAALFPLAISLVDRSASDGLLASRVAGGFFLQSATTLLLAVPLLLLHKYAQPLEIRHEHRVYARAAGFALPAALGVGILLYWSPDRQLPLVLATAWAIPALLLVRPAGGPRSVRGALRSWLIVGWLAATAALAFLWPMHMRAELARAERELTLLGTQPDPFLDFLLRQFAETAARLTNEGEGGVNLLYHSWVESSLARDGYEARIGLWRGGEALAELNLSELGSLPDPVLADVQSERDEPTVLHYGGLHGLHYLLAAPLDDGSVVSVAIPPRRRLGGATSLARFLHPGQDASASHRSEVLYLVPAETAGSPTGELGDELSADTVHWVRSEGGWRSETLVEMPEGTVHAHLVLTRAPLPLMLARAILVVTALLATLLLIWLMARAICGEFSAAPFLGGRWLRSFRGRLSVALFFFFLLPTVAFGAVSYGAVAREVIRSAESLAQQALDQAASDFAQAAFGGGRASSRPDLLLYRQGTLTAATAPEVLELGLFHSWLPPAVYLRFTGGEEMQALEERRLADSDYLVAYRRIDPQRVLAAPIPLASNEIRFRQREFRDIALLVILLGLGLSIVLSLLVGRALSRPLDQLSRAAATVGGGNLATRLPETRSDEFGNVYESFNTMVGRLHRTRAALVQETRRTETIVAEAATGVLALDAEGRVELINPRAAEILGGKVGRGDSLLAPEKSDGALSSAVSALLRSPAPEAGTELELDGRTVRMKLRRLPGEDGGGGAVIALEDVTAEMRTARVLAWGEMARQVAHEIKNPLTPIKLAVQHLRRAFEDRRPDFDQILDRNVQSILQEIDRLSEISRAFSRFGTPTAIASPLEPIDLRQAIMEVLALYRGTEVGATFRAELPTGLPPALARSGEIKEVLLNLLENAREAVGSKGEIVVTAAQDEIPGWLSIEVRDSGSGIPADQLPSIFEPHFSTRSSGTGLGLAIVRRIVDSWGGEIQARSTAGVGTCFTIRVRSA
jgi:two-component system nitrogen regulation sensor histidine kinase NtrY